MQTLDPSQNKRKARQNRRWVQITGATLFALVIVIMLALLLFKHHHKHAVRHHQPKPDWVPLTEMDNLTEHATDSAISQLNSSELSAQKTQTEKYRALDAKLAQLTTLVKRLTDKKKITTKPVTNTGATHPAVPTPHPDNISTPEARGNPNGNTGALGGGSYSPTPMNTALASGVADFSFTQATPLNAVDPDACDSKHCLLPGTFVKAVLIGGADANASVNGQSNTTPLLFRVLDRAHLPNGHTINIKGCFVVGTVYGDISSERGEVKLTHLSCVLHGKVISRPIALGTAYDIGGKEGIRGMPVMRNGKLLLYSGLSGFASGIGSALQQSYTTQSVSPLGATSTVNNGKIAQYGAATGASTALGKLASYYIKRADQYHPIIELNPGAKVDLVFLSQINLHPKAKTQAATDTPPATSGQSLSGLRFGQSVSARQALQLQKKLIQQYGGHQ